jgi:isocitrate lyase
VEATVRHMTITSQSIPAENGAIHSWQPISPGNTWQDSVELARLLVQADATVIRVGDYLQQARLGEQWPEVVLVRIDEAVEKLMFAREAAFSLGVELSIFACTEARRAMAINSDMDSRDRRYLSGLTSFPGLHAYCGGADATISRALSYAPHADVVGFKSSIPDISEARSFAAAIRLVHPEKQLAFGYSPMPNSPRWNELDHAAFESELHRVGFDHYFFTQFGSVVFPHSPSANHWVMLDDALKTASASTRNSRHLPAPLHGSDKYSPDA